MPSSSLPEPLKGKCQGIPVTQTLSPGLEDWRPLAENVTYRHFSQIQEGLTARRTVVSV